MKKFKTTIALIAIFGLVFTSCSDDDDDSNNSPSGSNPPASSSAISFDGNSYTLQSGTAEDYGPISVGGFNNTHYNYDFTTTDGVLTLVQDPNDPTNEILEISGTANIYVYTELFAPDTSSFKAGTYTYIADSLVNEASVNGKYWFSAADVGIDTTGNVTDEFDGPEYEVIGGSVVVSGTGPSSYTLNYNLQLEGGRTLTGTYNESFIFLD